MLLETQFNERNFFFFLFPFSFADQEPPDFPRNLHVIEKGSRYINISWTTSQDGNSPITQYIIEYKTDTGNRMLSFVIDVSRTIRIRKKKNEREFSLSLTLARLLVDNPRRDVIYIYIAGLGSRIVQQVCFFFSLFPFFFFLAIYILQKCGTITRFT